MSETLEWRRLYGARETLFVEGIGVGDYYPTTQGVFRARSRRLPAPAPRTDDARRQEDDRVEAAKLKARVSLPEPLRRRYRPGGGFPKAWQR
jgi:hypothetical protein